MHSVNDARHVLAAIMRGKIVSFGGVLDVDHEDGTGLVLRARFVPMGAAAPVQPLEYRGQALVERLSPGARERLLAWCERARVGPCRPFRCDFDVARSRSKVISARLTLTSAGIGRDGCARMEGVLVDNTSERIRRRLLEAPYRVGAQSGDNDFDRAFLASVVSAAGAHAAALTLSGKLVYWSDGESGPGSLVVDATGSHRLIRRRMERALGEFSGRIAGLPSGAPLQWLVRELAMTGVDTVASAVMQVQGPSEPVEVTLTLFWKGRLPDSEALLQPMRMTVVRMASHFKARRSNDVLGVIVDALSDGLCVVNARGEILSTNQRACEFFGVRNGQERRDLLGQPFTQWLKGRFAQAFTRWVRQPVRSPRRLGPMSIQRRDGGSSSVVELDMRPVGQSLSVLMICDVVDLLVLKEREVQARSMSMLGAISAGMAHDFNNVLSIIQNNLEATVESMRDIEVLDRARSDLNFTLLAVGRGAAITRRILALTSRRTDGAAITNLGELVDEWMLAIRHSLGPRTRLQCMLMEHLYARVVPSALQSALLNLVTNARDAMPEGGMITVNLSLRERNSVRASARSGWAVISVRDQGPGFTEEALLRATDTDYSTKRGDGHGLGLVSVRKFTEAVRGSLRIANLEGGGAIVEMYLPISRRAAIERSSHAVIGEDLPRPLDIMFVEDEAAIRAPLVQTLRRQGHRVKSVSSAESAMQIMQREGPPDILVSDVALGGIDGISLADWTRDRFPDTRVLLISGFLEIESSWPVLHKPFTPLALLNAIFRQFRPEELLEARTHVH